jgi:hypothetical protein
MGTEVMRATRRSAFAVAAPLAVIAEFASLSACAHTRGSEPGASLAAYNYSVVGSDAEGRRIVSVEGWLQQEGEFRLYARREDLGDLHNNLCVSGRFVTDTLHVNASQFQNRRVRIQGFYAHAADLPAEIGPFVENYCGSDVIIFGTAIEPLE